MDDTIAPAAGADNQVGNAEIPCMVDSLSIDGIAPNVGDRVDIKVSGPVTRVVNKMAYIKPETVNDTPMPADPLEPNPMVDEKDRLRTMSQQTDMMGSSY